MAKPVRLEVSSGSVGRGSRFYPHFAVVYDNGSRKSGPFHIFKPHLSLQHTTPGIVDFVNSRFTRNPGVRDAVVACGWNYSEGGGAVRGTSTVNVAGEPAHLEVSDGEVGPRGVFYPIFNIRFTDGSALSGPLHALGGTKPILAYTNPDVVIFKNSGFRLKPKAPTAKVECAWVYSESGVSVGALSSVEVQGTHESHLCLSEPLNVTPDSVVEDGGRLLHPYPGRPTPVMSEGEELIFQARQPAGLPVNVDVRRVGRDSSEGAREGEERNLKFDMAAGHDEEIAVPLFKGAINFIKFQVEGADPLLAPPRLLFVTQIGLNQLQPAALLQQQQQRQQQQRRRQRQQGDEGIRAYVERFIIEAKKFSRELAPFLDDWGLHDREDHETSRRTGRINLSRPQLEAALEVLKKADEDARRTGSNAEKERLERNFKWSMIEILLHEAGHSRAVKNRRHKFTVADEEDRNITELLNRLIDLLGNINDILCNRNHEGRKRADGAEMLSAVGDFADASMLFDDVKEIIFRQKIYRWSQVRGIKDRARSSETRLNQAGRELLSRFNELLRRGISDDERSRRVRQLVEDFHKDNRDDLQTFEAETGLTCAVQVDERCSRMTLGLTDTGKFGDRKIPRKGDCQ